MYIFFKNRCKYFPDIGRWSACLIFVWCFIHAIRAFAWQAIPLHSSDDTILVNIPDSINHYLKSTYDPEARITYLLRQAEIHQFRAPGLAMAMAQEALSLSEKTRYQQGKMKACFWLAWLKFYATDSGAYDKVLSLCDMAEQMSQQLGEPLWLAKTQALFAAVYWEDYNYERADAKLQLSLINSAAINGKPRDSTWIVAYALGIMANKHRDDLILAKKYWLSSLRLFESIQDHFGMARAWKNLAVAYSRMGNTDSTAVSYELAITHYARAGFVAGQKEALWKYANFCTQQYGQTKLFTWYDTAIKSLNKALALESSKQDCEVYRQLGVFYHTCYAMLKDDPTLQTSLLDSIVQYYNRALANVDENSNTKCLQNLIDNMARVCGTYGNCEELIQRMSAIFPRILNARKKESRQAQLIIKAFEEEQSARRQRDQLLFGGIIILGLCGLFIFFYQRLRIRNLSRELTAQKAVEEADRKALEAEIKALRAQQALWRAQINPHFISNALTAIESLVNHQRNGEAAHYLIQFSHLSRMILNQSGNETIRLAEELTALEYYISLEQLRLGEDIFSYTIKVDEHLNQELIQVPPMLFQPFVENAIWHGIQPKKRPGHLTFRIDRLGQSEMLCVVEDDGIGRQKSQELKKQSLMAHKSWGLALTKLRMDAFEGIKGADMEIIDLTGPDGKPSGTQVRIVLPLQTDKQDHD